MLNVTSRLAVKTKHVPDNVSWTDTTCQRMRASLTISDIIPGPAEAKIFYDDAVLTVMELLVFDHLNSHLARRERSRDKNLRTACDLDSPRVGA